MARILVLSSRWPFPPFSGDMIRILNICRQLAPEHSLHLVCLCDHSPQPVPAEYAGVFERIDIVRLSRWRSYANALLALLGREPLQVAYYRSARCSEIVAAALPTADIVLAHLIRMAQYVGQAKPRLRVLEMTDAISLNYERVRATAGRRTLLRRIHEIEQQRVANYEQQCVERFDLVSLVAAVDRDHLAARVGAAGARKLLVAPNGADPTRFAINVPAGGTRLLFLGKMSTAPNIDACEFFMQECLPAIRRERPTIELKIVGPISPALASRWSRRPGVLVCGAVPSLLDAVQDVFCGIAPMRLGAGIQNKILDYMGMGLPSVVSSLALQGLSARADEEILQADRAEDWVSSIVKLHDQRGRAQRIGAAGREYVRRAHSWAACLRPLVASFRQAAAVAHDVPFEGGTP